jgi:exonuclease SbcC
MIPQRVYLKGFLCYKQEQTVDFDSHATLWMLSGLNGSGKSAIFDAVTFALFSAHRGGSSGHVELINKECDTAVIEFDFLLDDHLYRAKRTLKRDSKGGARGTQQLLLYNRTEEKWAALEETHQKKEFDAWITHEVGLNYETFTSSVLLLQGKAERLLNSTPNERREVLARIVDLTRYERLFQKADDKRRVMESELKAIVGRMNALPVVLPLELAEAKGKIENAEEERKTARDLVEKLAGVEYQARAWVTLQQQTALAQSRWTRAQQVLKDAAAIEEAVKRLSELREMTPRFHEIVIFRGQIKQAEDHLRDYTREREKQSEARALKEQSLRAAHEKRSNLQAGITQNETRTRDLSKQLRTLSQQMQNLKECERQEADLERLRAELQNYKMNPTKEVTVLREQLDAVDAVNRVVPVLVRFRTFRDELISTTSREGELEKLLLKVQQKGQALKEQLEQQKSKVEEASRELEIANSKATEAKTLLTQARESLRELSEVEGAKVCRHCGQALTPGHIGEEKRRRAQEEKAALKRSNEANKQQETARTAHEASKKQLEQIEQQVQVARDEYTETRNQMKQAKASVARSQQDCALAYSEAATEYQTKISTDPHPDWRTTSYPTAKDIEALRLRTSELEPTRRKLREAEQRLQKHGQLQAQEQVARETLERFLRDLPADREGLRRDHASKEAEEKALFKQTDAQRVQLKDCDKDIEKLTREKETIVNQLSDTETKLKQHELMRDNARRGIDLQMKTLPPAWQAQAQSIGIKDLSILKSEQKSLEDEHTDERGKELDHARHNLKMLEQEVAQLLERQKEYPPEARIDPASIGERLIEARAIDRDCDERLAKAREQLALLENVMEQRRQLDAEYKGREAEVQSQKILAELLGKDRLQLYLVRQAERQIVEYANAVLDRLSGGQLYLKLVGEAGGDGTSAKALDLEAFNRATGEKPINVAFLSGSQKFRVAVGLALGIGQYASRQHRPIESVIIDEGFGCLDSQGRQVMIQELQNLRSQMRCILLVSHQEDFAEAFSDGYQFRLENGATKVERFRK